VLIHRPDGTVLRALVAGEGPTVVLAHGYCFIVQHLEAHGPLLSIMHAIAREDRYRRLAKITVPTVVILGSADRATVPSHSRRLAAGVPGARLVTVPDAGHLLNWEGPDALVEGHCHVRCVSVTWEDRSGEYRNAVVQGPSVSG